MVGSMTRSVASKREESKHAASLSKQASKRAYQIKQAFADADMNCQHALHAELTRLGEYE